MRSSEDILGLYAERRAFWDPIHAKMYQIRTIYSGEMLIDLPDVDKTERPSVPNLLNQGIDQTAGRVSSVTPTIGFASAKPGSRRYDRRAADASRTISGFWQRDRLMTKMKVRARRLIAYGMAPVVVRWNHKEHRPEWNVRHPLEAFPAPNLEPGVCLPTDAIFAYDRTVAWMQKNGYGDHLGRLVTRREDLRPDAQVTLVEYIDEDVTMLMAVRYQAGMAGWSTPASPLRGVVLGWYPNLGKIIPVSIPSRITLDAVMGQFDGTIGTYYQQARLMALEMSAVEKGIYPDTYLESRPGEVARFVEGPYDGRSGNVNIVQGGVIKELQTTPGYMTPSVIDRLERAQRVTGGIPAEFGGESGSNIRTGRRGDAVLSAVIDFPVAEAQEQFAHALEDEDRIAIRLAKAIDGDTPRTIYVGVGNARRPVTYTPNSTFEVEEHVVSYPATGADMNALIIGVGQRIGLRTMSKQTAASLDPYIDDPEVEHDRITQESLEEALLQGILQQAQQGAIPPLVLSKLMTLVGNDNMELADALVKVTEDAAKEQAAQQQAAGGQPGAPPSADQAMSAQAMAALAGGIQGPEQSIPGAANLADLLSTLRKPVMAVQDRTGRAGSV